MSFLDSINSLYAQHSFVLGDTLINEYSNSICADNNGNIFIGATKNDKSVIIKYKDDVVLWSVDLEYSSPSDFGSINIVGDTIFGCGWLKNGNTILGSTFFKMNAKTGSVYWKYEESSSKIYFSSMRYAHGVYYIVGSEINGGLNYDGKVIAINSTTGSLIWQTPVMGLTFPTFNNDYIDDFVSSTNMVNGKMFITGRTYCNGAPEVMRPTLIGINDKGTVFLTKYISFDTQIDYTNRFYGVKIEYDGQDSLVLFQHGDDKSTSTDYKTCISKMDTTGKVSWTKEYDIQGYSVEIVRSCNITPNEYVVFGSVEVLSGNPKVFAMKFTKNGDFIKGNMLGYKSSKISVTNGPIFVGGNSTYINNHNYFVASTYVSSTTQKDIIALVLDDNLSDSHNCFSFNNLQVTTKSYIPFSGVLNRIDKNLNVTYTKNTVIEPRIHIGSPCDKSINFSSNPLNCSDNKITASVPSVSDTNFIWSNGKIGKSIYFTNTDTLFVSIYDPANCCTIKDTIVPIIKNTTNLTVTLNDTVICPNTSITLKPIVKSTNGVNPTFSYLWNNGSKLPTLQVNTDGLYYCEVSDGCSKVRDSAYVSLINKPEVDILDTNFVFCSKIEPFTVSPVLNNYTSFSWSDGTATQGITISSSGDYYISATNSCGTTKKGIHIKLIPTLVHNPTINDTVGCVPFEFKLFDNLQNPLVKQIIDDGNGNLTNFTTNYLYKFTKSGNYSLKYITINQGCADTIIYSISVYDQPVASFVMDKHIMESSDNKLTITNTSQNATAYSWTFGDGSAIDNSINPTHFYTDVYGLQYIILEARNKHNCIDTAIQTLKILEDLIFYVPNTFTPDGNEFNNVFNPVFYSGYDPYHYSMLIFNRWGEIIFETHNVKIGWDGTYHDKICPDGTYVWKIKFNDSNYGNGHEYVGHVNLIRK